MIAGFVVCVFFGVVTCVTGPAFDGWRARRRARRDAPMAKVIYLPSAACRRD